MRFLALLCVTLSPILSGCTHAHQQRGVYVFGHQIRTVQMCGDPHVYWVVASREIRSRLESEHRRLTGRPYGEIYLEFRGETLEGPCEGFAAEYHGTMEITGIQEISATVPEDCRGGPSKHTAASTPQTFVFTCDDNYEFVARADGEEAWVFRPGGTVRLPRLPSASGSKYSDGSATLWTKGQQAFLEEGGKTHRGCRNDPRRAVWEHAKLNGADFRAVGNEPGWTLEILQQSKILLVTDYGTQRYEFELPEPTVDREAWITRYETRQRSHKLVILLRAQSCRDTMSDEIFETTAVVNLDGRELRGCGRALH